MIGRVGSWLLLEVSAFKTRCSLIFTIRPEHAIQQMLEATELQAQQML